jgi:hypothetical protein
MALVFTGRSAGSEQNKTLLEAYDGTKRVVVVASQEAIDDFDLDGVEDKATEKYGAGKLDDAGRVVVLMSDFV